MEGCERYRTLQRRLNHFEAGFVGAPPAGESIEVYPDATLGFTQKLSGTLCYRNFRMVNLYAPPSKD